MSDEVETIQDLVTALVAKTNEMAQTDHPGHYNRLFGQRAYIFARIDAHEAGFASLVQLLDHADPHVQLAVAQHCKYRNGNFETAINKLQLLAARSDRIGFDARFSLKYGPSGGTPDTASIPEPRRFPFLPQPQGCSKATAQQMINAALAPDLAEKVVELLRPAIRLWPKPLSGSPIASQFGGLPALPDDFEWPFADEEPFVFLAQINCAAFDLPSRGLLSFFGDNADINGVPSNGGAVYFFDDPDRLFVRELPMPDGQPLMSCGMGFYETWEVPNYFSDAVGALGVSDKADKRASDSYFDLETTLTEFGFEKEWSLDDNDISKLFGWANLVQQDIIYEGHNDRLLCQLGQYRDGNEINCWGPGGLLYFTITPNALALHDFDRAELIMQCT